MKFTLPKVQEKPFKCRLVSARIEIQGQDYLVVPDESPKSYQVTKLAPTEENYMVIHDSRAGVNKCSCPDYFYRHRGNGHGICKHGRALVALGFLPPPIFGKRG